MKNHILQLALIVALFRSATAFAQSPMYPQQVPPTPTVDVPPSAAAAQQSQYNQSLPPTNLAPYSAAPYSPTPYSPAPGSPGPYIPPPSGPPSYRPAPSGPSYTPAPYTPSPYAPSPYGPPAYTPAPGTRASYDGPPPYTPAPYSPAPYSQLPYGPPSYTPAPGAPEQVGPPAYTPAPSGPPAYIPAPSGPPAYTPAPIEGIPNAALEGPRWIFSADALFLERSVGSSVPLGYTVYNPGSGNPQAIPTDTLFSDDELDPLETGVRFQFGRRFTDDIAVDATYWGLQQWSVGRNIYGDPIGDSVLAFSPWTQTDALIGGFNNSLGYTDKSQVNNFEINERIQFNEHDPYHSLAWLWGFRYFQFSDNFTLSGSDLDTGDYENINWKTQNELLGLQAGLQWTRGWDRFQVVTEGKAGIFANLYSQKGNNLDSSGVATGNPAGFVPFNVSHDGTDVSGLFELSVLARYRLNEFLWLRLGYQAYCMTGLALGARQLGGYSHGGTVAFDGPSVGMEATW